MYKSVLLTVIFLRLFLNFEDILENDLEMLLFAEEALLFTDYSDFSISMMFSPPSRFSLDNYLETNPVALFCSIEF